MKEEYISIYGIIVFLCLGIGLIIFCALKAERDCRYVDYSNVRGVENGITIPAEPRQMICDSIYVGVNQLPEYICH